MYLTNSWWTTIKLSSQWERGTDSTGSTSVKVGWWMDGMKGVGVWRNWWRSEKGQRYRSWKKSTVLYDIRKKEDKEKPFRTTKKRDYPYRDEYETIKGNLKSRVQEFWVLWGENDWRGDYTRGGVRHCVMNNMKTHTHTHTYGDQRIYMYTHTYVMSIEWSETIETVFYHRENECQH